MDTSSLLLMQGSWSVSQLLLVVQGFTAVCVLIVGIFYSLRLGSTKAWKDLAEQRKETIDDRDKEILRLKETAADLRYQVAEAERDLKRANDRSNEATQGNFELQGKVRAYERKYGPLEAHPDR